MVFRVKQDNNLRVYDLLPKVIQEEEKWRQWAFQNGTFAFKVREEPLGEIKEIYDLPNGVEANDLEDAQERIYEVFDGYKEQQRQGFKPKTESPTNSYPYDPKTINISNFNWSIDTIRHMLNRKLISLSSDFRRNSVWDNTRKSRLIESIFLGIPIPTFYLAKEETGSYHVIDGLQRLITIKEFLNNEFSLIHLEYFTGKNNTDNLEGFYYQTQYGKQGINTFKNGEYEFKIFSTQLDVNVIGASTPIPVQVDIFRRLNNGSTSLNSQELRNSFMSSPTRLFINSLSESVAFKNATGNSISSQHIENQEFVLLFIGFWYIKILGYKKESGLKYEGDVQDFLNNVIEFLNKADSKTYKDIELYFKQGLSNASYLFGDYCFRKCLPKHLEHKARKPLINKYLFIAWSTLLSIYKNTNIVEKNEFNKFVPILAYELSTDKELFSYISQPINNQKIDIVFEKIKLIIKKHLQL